ncbi:MAG: N-acetylmuramoyl-L-alanine amidase [Firmicutes bacterium]|nr:N-acetylmuramoyl-L-alanine amidase [Bacillota bacterium]
MSNSTIALLIALFLLSQGLLPSAATDPVSVPRPDPVPGSQPDPVPVPRPEPQIPAPDTSPGTGGGSSPGSLTGKLIVLDPGHGGIDVGATGPSGTREKNNTLATAWKLKAALESAGATVILTRTGDYEPGASWIGLSNSTALLRERARIANSAGAHVFISIHNDGNTNPSVNGTTTYYYSAPSYYLAQAVQEELVWAFGSRNIGVIPRGFLVIKEAAMPAILVELGFITNWEEENLLRSDWYQQVAAKAIVSGLSRYFRDSGW